MSQSEEDVLVWYLFYFAYLQLHYAIRIEGTDIAFMKVTLNVKQIINNAKRLPRRGF